MADLSIGGQTAAPSEGEGTLPNVVSKAPAATVELVVHQALWGSLGGGDHSIAISAASREGGRSAITVAESSSYSTVSWTREGVKARWMEKNIGGKAGPSTQRGPIRACAVSPCCTVMASGSQDGKIAVFALKTGDVRRLCDPDTHQDTVTAAAFISSGSLLTAGSDGKVARWEWDRGNMKQACFPSAKLTLGHTILTLCVEGDAVVAGTADGAIHILHVGGGGVENVSTIFLPLEPVRGISYVAIHPEAADTGIVMTIAINQVGTMVAHIFDVYSLTSEEPIDTEEQLAFSSRAMLASLRHQATITGVVWLKCERIATASRDSTVKIWAGFGYGRNEWNCVAQLNLHNSASCLQRLGHGFCVGAASCLAIVGLRKAEEWNLKIAMPMPASEVGVPPCMVPSLNLLGRGISIDVLPKVLAHGITCSKKLLLELALSAEVNLNELERNVRAAQISFSHLLRGLLGEVAIGHTDGSLLLRALAEPLSTSGALWSALAKGKSLGAAFRANSLQHTVIHPVSTAKVDASETEEAGENQNTLPFSTAMHLGHDRLGQCFSYTVHSPQAKGPPKSNKDVAKVQKPVYVKGVKMVDSKERQKKVQIKTDDSGDKDRDAVDMDNPDDEVIDYGAEFVFSGIRGLLLYENLAGGMSSLEPSVGKVVVSTESGLALSGSNSGGSNLARKMCQQQVILVDLDSLRKPPRSKKLRKHVHILGNSERIPYCLSG